DWLKRQEEQGGGTPGGVMVRLATPLVAATAILALSAPGCHSVHERSAKVSKPAAALPQSFRTLRYVVVCRNGVATEEGIYDITYYGKGRMPASGLLSYLYIVCATEA
ncbi:hypothetical protein B296_00022961, partial [Ensete ventricosum]